MLGAGLQDGTPFNWGAVDLYEVVLYARSLESDELDKLETYCRARRALAWNPMHIGGDLQWFHDVGASAFQLSEDAISQWDDLTGANRHWAQSGSARPLKTIDELGRDVVRFDGVDDVMLMSNDLPVLEPFSIALIYRIREHGDMAGLITAAPASGVDHTDFWTFRSVASTSDVELFGRSLEEDELNLSQPADGDLGITIWSTSNGTAELADRDGVGSDTYDGGFGTPAEIVLGGRYDGAPFGFAKIDVTTTVGVARALSTADQQKLLNWAASRWGI